MLSMKWLLKLELSRLSIIITGLSNQSKYLQSSLLCFYNQEKFNETHKYAIDRKSTQFVDDHITFIFGKDFSKYQQFTILQVE